MNQVSRAIRSRGSDFIDAICKRWIRAGRIRGKTTQLSGFLRRVVLYVILIDMSFVFLYPFLYIVITSLKSVQDYLDPTVFWVPRSIEFENFRVALSGLVYWESFRNSACIALVSAIAQVISCSMVGYGFARIDFKFRDTLFAVALLTFIIPPQTIIVPLFMTYKRLGWLDTYLPFLIPGLLANGLRGALFIYIFRQFFRGLPWELEDAAMIDGAGPLRMFSSIMLPLARPAIIVTFLFSLVWHWNDTYEPSIYLMSSEHFTLPLRLSRFWFELQSVFGITQAETMYNEPIIMAASLLVILPMLVVYVFAQRYFVEGIERTGLVG